LQHAAHELAVSEHGILPVIGDDGCYHGCVTARAVAEALASGGRGVGTTVTDLAELPPLVTWDSSLSDALTVLTNAPGTALPVLTTDDQLTGWITHQSILDSLKLTTSQ
jgi:CIC family chloride channel protein